MIAQKRKGKKSKNRTRNMIHLNFPQSSEETKCPAIEKQETRGNIYKKKYLQMGFGKDRE